MQTLADSMAEKFHESFLGETADVLFETETDGIIDGLTDTYIRVYTDARLPLGEIAQMKLTKLYKDGVWGVPV